MLIIHVGLWPQKLGILQCKGLGHEGRQEHEHRGGDGSFGLNRTAGCPSVLKHIWLWTVTLCFYFRQALLPAPMDITLCPVSWRFCQRKLFPLQTGDDHTPLPVDLSMSPEHWLCLQFLVGQSVWVQLPDHGCCISSEEKKRRARRCVKSGNSWIFICLAIILDLHLLGLRGEVLGAKRILYLELSLLYHPDFSEIRQMRFAWVCFHLKTHGSPFPAIIFISDHHASPSRSATLVQACEHRCFALISVQGRWQSSQTAFGISLDSHYVIPGLSRRILSGFSPVVSDRTYRPASRPEGEACEVIAVSPFPLPPA